MGGNAQSVGVWPNCVCGCVPIHAVQTIECCWYYCFGQPTSARWLSTSSMSIGDAIAFQLLLGLNGPPPPPPPPTHQGHLRNGVSLTICHDMRFTARVLPSTACTSDTMYLYMSGLRSWSSRFRSRTTSQAIAKVVRVTNNHGPYYNLAMRTLSASRSLCILRENIKDNRPRTDCFSCTPHTDMRLHRRDQPRTMAERIIWSMRLWLQ